jgi:hypothetical protein
MAHHMARLVLQLQQQQRSILKQQRRMQRLFLKIKRLKREQRWARELHLKLRACDMLVGVQRLRGRLEGMCVDIKLNWAIVAGSKTSSAADCHEAVTVGKALECYTPNANERVLSPEDMEFAIKMIAIVDPLLTKIESVLDRLRENGARVLQMRYMPRGVKLSLSRNEETVTKLSATMVKLELSVQTLGRVAHGLGFGL